MCKKNKEVLSLHIYNTSLWVGGYAETQINTDSHKNKERCLQWKQQ